VGEEVEGLADGGVGGPRDEGLRWLSLRLEVGRGALGGLAGVVRQVFGSVRAEALVRVGVVAGGRRVIEVASRRKAATDPKASSRTASRLCERSAAARPSSSEMMRRIDARISSIEGSCGFGWAALIASSLASSRPMGSGRRIAGPHRGTSQAPRPGARKARLS
jgi:hypothetical protein